MACVCARVCVYVYACVRARVNTLTRTRNVSVSACVSPITKSLIINIIVLELMTRESSL